MSFYKPLLDNTDDSVLVRFFKKTYFDEALSYSSFKYGEIPYIDLYRENFYYGLIDTNGDIIQPINIKNNFTTFFTDEGGEQKVQNFVADALKDMKEYLSTSLLLNKISKNTPYTNIKIYRSHSNLSDEVISTQISYASYYKLFAYQNNKENASISNHKDFVYKFIKYLVKNFKEQINITKTGIILSNNFSNFTSGLVFDINVDSCNNDENKYNKYLNSEEFSCFKEACIRFGFRIDKNIPWRLAADISSPAMKPYLDKYSINNLNDLFSQRYKKVFLDEIYFLKSFFYKSYSYFISDNESYEKDIDKICSIEYNKNYLLYRNSVSLEQFSKDFPDTFWLRVYAYLRNIETSSNLTQQKFDNIVREAQKLIRYNKQDEAVKYLNNYFNVSKNVFISTNIPIVDIVL
jgi:hypothetical protein